MRILKALGSNAQPCGCLIGIYETYGGHVVRLVDSTGESCARHRLDQQIEPGEMAIHTPELSRARSSD